MSTQISHDLRTAISTGGMVSQRAAQMRSALLATFPTGVESVWAQKVDDEDLRIGPIDAPEFMPNGAAGFANGGSVIARG